MAPFQQFASSALIAMPSMEYICEDGAVTLQKSLPQEVVDADQETVVIDMTEGSSSDSEASYGLLEDSVEQTQETLVVEAEWEPLLDAESINVVAWQSVSLKISSTMKSLDYEGREDDAFAEEPVNIANWYQVGSKMATLFARVSVDSV